ncbi:MAG: hypothetical protein AVDCRST_MAG59-4961, partial [uncultured Thermomicrobiales bacterium]
ARWGPHPRRLHRRHRRRQEGSGPSPGSGSAFPFTPRKCPRAVAERAVVPGADRRPGVSFGPRRTSPTTTPGPTTRPARSSASTRRAAVCWGRCGTPPATIPGACTTGEPTPSCPPNRSAAGATSSSATSGPVSTPRPTSSTRPTTATPTPRRSCRWWTGSPPTPPASLHAASPAPDAKRIADLLEVRHTPKHGCGPNVAELEPAVLERQCLRLRHPDRAAPEATVAARAAHRNVAGAAVARQFATADARTQL